MFTALCAVRRDVRARRVAAELDNNQRTQSHDNPQAPLAPSSSRGGDVFNRLCRAHALITEREDGDQTCHSSVTLPPPPPTTTEDETDRRSQVNAGRKILLGEILHALQLCAPAWSPVSSPGRGGTLDLSSLLWWADMSVAVGAMSRLYPSSATCPPSLKSKRLPVNYIPIRPDLDALRRAAPNTLGLLLPNTAALSATGDAVGIIQTRRHPPNGIKRRRNEGAVECSQPRAETPPPRSRSPPPLRTSAKNAFAFTVRLAGQPPRSPSPVPQQQQKGPPSSLTQATMLGSVAPAGGMPCVSPGGLRQTTLGFNAKGGMVRTSHKAPVATGGITEVEHARHASLHSRRAHGQVAASAGDVAPIGWATGQPPPSSAVLGRLPPSHAGGKTDDATGRPAAGAPGLETDTGYARAAGRHIERHAPPRAPAQGGPATTTDQGRAAAGNPSAGFVTAGEQLLSDIKAGRTSVATSSFLSKRSPALGLRRTGFQAPFQQQQSPPADDSNALTANKVMRAMVGGGTERPAAAEANKSKRCSNDEGDDEPGQYPASLLLPDGTVPPVLLPLDPKLVTQVAMEVLEHGAGAKHVGWDDIAGLKDAKSSIEEAIVWPLRRPDLFVGLRNPPRGLLLFGPPGTGKTMIARAIANRADGTFFNMSASSLMSKWLGEGEKLVRCLFAVAAVKQPSVIFIDEVDSLLSARGEGEMDSVRRVKTEFLVQLDGVATDGGDRVLLIGATNRPDELDEAARRRLEKRLYIPLPDRPARIELIRRLLQSMEQSTTVDHNTAGALQGDANTPERRKDATAPAAKLHDVAEADLHLIADSTEGYSGADLKQLCHEAAMGPLRDISRRQLCEVAACDIRPILYKDFKQALKRVKPSVGAGEVERYTKWNEQYGSFVDCRADDDGEEEEEEG